MKYRFALPALLCAVTINAAVADDAAAPPPPPPTVAMDQPAPPPPPAVAPESPTSPAMQPPMPPAGASPMMQPPSHPGMMPHPQVAQDPPLPPPDARSLAVAQEIVKSFDMKSQLENMVTMMTKSAVPMIDHENPGQGEKVEKITGDTLKRVIMAHMDDMNGNKATVYAQMFTYPELLQLKKFYASPLGKKVSQTTPEMMRRNAALDRATMSSTIQDARKQLAEDLKANDLKVPKPLGGQ